MKKQIVTINNDFGECDIALKLLNRKKSEKTIEDIRWNFQKESFLREILRHEMMQNEELGDELLETGDLIIAECISDTDCGTGLDKEDPDIYDTLKWKGKNILGYVLMQVREDIRKMRSGTDEINISTIVPVNLNVIKGDITTLSVDAIVNAARPSLLGGGGVDGAIHRAAGPDLLKECRTLNGAVTGEAKITGGYNLPAEYVIHTVGPVWHGGTHGEAEKLEECYRHSLMIAYEKGLKSIAFPSISTGAYGYPVEKAAYVAMEAVIEFLQFHPDYTPDIKIVGFDDYTCKTYEKAVFNSLKELVYGNAENIGEMDMDNLLTENIVAFTVAESGAGGCPGDISLYMSDGHGMKVLYGNYLYDDFDLEKLKVLFPPLAVFAKESEINTPDKNWKRYYMGMGNHLVLHEKLVEVIGNLCGAVKGEWLYEYHDSLILSAFSHMKRD